MAIYADPPLDRIPLPMLAGRSGNLYDTAPKNSNAVLQELRLCHPANSELPIWLANPGELSYNALDSLASS